MKFELEAVAGGKVSPAQPSPAQITAGVFKAAAGVATMNVGLIADGGNRIQASNLMTVSIIPLSGW